MLAKEILKKYVVADGEHPILKETALKGGNNDTRQTIYQFPNGYRVSVVSGGLFYTDENHPYEMMVVNEDIYEPDPIGYLDEFGLLAKLVEIMEREVVNGIQE